MLDLAWMDGNDTDTIHFPADAQAVAVAVAAAHAFAAQHDLSDTTAARLAIVVEELVTNLVEHGGTAGTPIALSMACCTEGIAIGLSDYGVAFDPRDAVTSELPPERGGGAGIALVLAWARIEGYRSIDGANRLDLILVAET